jgi:hypothetical protein
VSRVAIVYYLYEVVGFSVPDYTDCILTQRLPSQVNILII